MLVIGEEILKLQLLTQQFSRDGVIEIDWHWDPLQHGFGAHFAKETHHGKPLLGGGLFDVKFVENVIRVSYSENAQLRVDH